MFEMYDFQDVGCSRCGIFGMWDVRNVDVQDVGCPGCRMLGTRDIQDVGCSECGMGDVCWYVGC